MQESRPMRDYEEHLMLGRAEIAARLHELADQIAQGSLSLGQGRVQSPVPDVAEIEWR